MCKSGDWYHCTFISYNRFLFVKIIYDVYEFKSSQDKSFHSSKIVSKNFTKGNIRKSVELDSSSATYCVALGEVLNLSEAC